MINKLDSRCAVVRFCYHSYDYRPNWTPLSPITTTTSLSFVWKRHVGVLWRASGVGPGQRSRSPSLTKRIATSGNEIVDLRDSLLGPQFSCHATQKLGNSNVPYYKKKNPVELKRCETSSSYSVFNLMRLKPREER